MFMLIGSLLSSCVGEQGEPGPVGEQGDKTLEKQETKTLETYKNKFKNIVKRYRLDVNEEEEAIIDSLMRDSLEKLNAKDSIEK